MSRLFKFKGSHGYQIGQAPVAYDQTQEDIRDLLLIIACAVVGDGDTPSGKAYQDFFAARVLTRRDDGQ